jgi:hypothetical protein
MHVTLTFSSPNLQILFLILVKILFFMNGRKDLILTLLY